MDIGDFNFKDIGKNIQNNNTLNDIVTNFINELSNILENSMNKNIDNVEREIDKTQKVEDGTICVVYGHNDERITLLNPDDGKEFYIYVATSNEVAQKLKDQGINSNDIYIMDKSDFFSLDLGTKLKMNNGKYEIYNGEMEVKDTRTWYALNDLYYSLKKDEGTKFIIDEIKDDKIYMKYESGGGNLYTYRELYPNLKEGDIVKRVGGKYIKE